MADRIIKWLGTFAFTLLCTLAVQAESTDAALEARVTQITQELRCLVCQNQTIADSTADLAIDLKNQVREQLARGQTDRQVIDFMVQRYGVFVLYRPPVKRSTWLLWFGPLTLLFGGIGFLLVKIRQQTPAGQEPKGVQQDDRLFEDHVEESAA